MMRSGYAFNAVSFATNAALCFLLWDLDGAKFLFWLAIGFCVLTGWFGVKWIGGGRG